MDLETKINDIDSKHKEGQLSYKEKDEALLMLEEASTNSTTTSKIRRQIRRLIERLKSKDVEVSFQLDRNANKSDDSNIDNDKNNNSSSSTLELASRLNRALNEDALLESLNQMDLKSLDTEGNRIVRKHCLVTLKTLLLDKNNRTTARTIRRIFRMVFVLSDTETKEEYNRLWTRYKPNTLVTVLSLLGEDIAAAASASSNGNMSASAATDRITKQQLIQLQSQKVNEVHQEEGKGENRINISAFSDCINFLENAQNADDVVKVVDTLTATVTADTTTDTNRTSNEDEGCENENSISLGPSLIEALSGVTSIVNAKIRRRVNRIINQLQALSPSIKSTSNTTVTATAADGGNSDINNDGKLINESNEEVETTNQDGNGSEPTSFKPTIAPPSNTPFIAFVGQLAYKTTKDKIEAFLRRNGIEGDVNIRLLTTKEGTSRGQAFIQVEGPRELRKVLSLHHKSLEGRRINVEASTGGRNKKKRAETIAKRRLEREPTQAEAVDDALRVYIENGAIGKLPDSVVNPLYEMDPLHFKELLSKFEKESAGTSQSQRIRHNLGIMKKLVSETTKRAKLE